MKITLTVEGLAECEQALGELISTVGVSRATGKNTVRRAMRHALEPVRDSMIAKAPRLRGKLKSVIAISTQLTRRQKSQYVAQDPVEMHVGALNVPQAHLQEFGTAHHAPQPFARPAVDGNITNITQRFSSQLWLEIKRTAERHARKAARLLKMST